MLKREDWLTAKDVQTLTEQDDDGSRHILDSVYELLVAPGAFDVGDATTRLLALCSKIERRDAARARAKNYDWEAALQNVALR